MVMEYGMSECGQRSFSSERATFIQSPNGSLSAAREYSESVAEKIDKEISAILSSAYQRVKKLLSSKSELLEHLSKILMEKEVIEGKELSQLMAEFSQETSLVPETEPRMIHSPSGSESSGFNERPAEL
jgi:cell division protease FtsH